MSSVLEHYDLLIEKGNDPVLDGKALSEYMDKWDGKKFVSLLDLDKDKTVLEIGCGTGRILKKIVNTYKSYVGIDISPKTIETAKTHFIENTDISFICEDFLNTNIDQNFDVIFSTLTFMHFENKLLPLTKIHQLLNNGGKVVLSIDKNQRRFIDTGFSQITIFPDNPKTICKLLTSIGFKNVKTKKVKFAYLITAQKL